MGDLSPRAREALESADFWIVEDTRVSGKLAALLGVKRPMSVLNDHSSPFAIEQLVRRIQNGERACLLTDAGSPVVSDPGTELADACHSHGLSVDSVPGPSAVTNALALSGFYAQRFAFLGFLPRKASAAADVLAPFSESTLTLVLFESPFRLAATVNNLFAALGARRFAVCREMTKLHQQTILGTLPELPGPDVLPQKGETTIVVEGKRQGFSTDD